MHYRPTDFEEVVYANIVPVCPAELIGACGAASAQDGECEAVLAKCRLCARRYTQHGWLDADQSAGVWQGCAHAMRLLDIMAS